MDITEKATEIALINGQISISMLKRDLKIGYKNARNIIDKLEYNGISGGKNGQRPRKVFVSLEEYKENKDFAQKFGQAINLIHDRKDISLSFLQNNLKIGYPRAFKIMERLEKMKLVGGKNGQRPRKVLI